MQLGATFQRTIFQCCFFMGIYAVFPNPVFLIASAIAGPMSSAFFGQLPPDQRPQLLLGDPATICFEMITPFNVLSYFLVSRVSA